MSGSDPELQLPITLTLDNHAGPAPRIAQERLDAMVASALVEYDKINPLRAEHAGAGAKTTSSLAKPSPWLVAAGSALAIAASVAAARYFFVTPESKPTPAVIAPASPEPVAQPMAAESARPQTTPATEPDQPDDLDAPAADEGPSARSSDRSDKGRRALARTAPEDLLQKANQLRAAGQFRDAAQTYSLVYDRFPKSQAAYVARVAAGSLELEHLSNPLKARKLFESALQDRPKGALDLEARQGLSVALRDLEDRSGEREALRSLVTRHPGSPAARRAQVRLTELGGE